MKAKRQKHSGAFKAKVAIEALQERETIVELSMKYGMHPNQKNGGRKSFWRGLHSCLRRHSPQLTTKRRLKGCMPRLGSWRWNETF